jgi:nitric oxide reductase large subunit
MTNDDYGCAVIIAIILLLCGIGLMIWVIIEMTGFKL